MNILIGKLGRSIYFDRNRWSMFAGDEEAILLYLMLANRHPEHTFYLIGKSDLKNYRKKCEDRGAFMTEMSGDLVVPDNIVNMFDGWNNKIEEDDHIWMEKQVAALGINFDLGIIYQGPTPNIGIPNMGIKCMDGERDAKTLEMFQHYYAPIMHVLNVTQVPYFSLCGDPRYVPLHQRDCFNDEKFILSQINISIDGNRILGYDKPGELRRHTMNYHYAGIETVFMLDQPRIDFRKKKKDNLFVMGLNGGGDRESIIKEWILNHSGGDGIKIYGKWDPAFTEKFPGVFEEKAIKDVVDIFWSSRYTMIPPFSKKMHNFVTQKFWKMIYFGIIPFFHPQYDTGKIYPIPDILRVASPDDMWEKIQYLEANPEEYDKILNRLWEFMDDKYFNGDFLHGVIQRAATKTIGKEL